MCIRDRVAPVAAQVLRFRVLANSDSPEDQALKLQVRDGLLDLLGPVSYTHLDVYKRQD